MAEPEEEFRILYVEDDDSAFETWGERLETIDTHRLEENTRHKPVVIRARNQEEAVAAIESVYPRGFDLVILDLRYPVDGRTAPDDNDFQGLKWVPDLSQRLPDAAIVVFTAHSIDPRVQDRVTRLLQDGIHEFVPKGTPWAEMELRIRFAWRFARQMWHRQLLQHETANLMLSRAAQIYLHHAEHAVADHFNRAINLVNDLSRMGESGAERAEALRGFLGDLKHNVNSIVEKASNRKSTLQCEPDLNTWLRDSLFSYFYLYREQRVRLYWPTGQKVNLCSHLDDVRVVVHELLQNSLCSIVCANHPDGKATVTIAQREEGVEISVEDNGIGFDPDDLNSGRVFMRNYSRWPKLGPELVQHQGMGLNIAKLLVNNLGGALGAMNLDSRDPSRGARVTLLIPDLPEAPR